MNQDTVRNILDVLKTSTDKKIVLKGLIKLRTDLVKDTAGVILFREAGGVPPMVRYLFKPHDEILDVALSILGNCCLDAESCKQVLNAKILPCLVGILKTVQNDTVRQRACRLLGNLAKSDGNTLMGLHSSTITLALCELIEQTSNNDIRYMAFRAFKYLLRHKEFAQIFLRNNGFTLALRILADIIKNKNQEQLMSDAAAVDETADVTPKYILRRKMYFESVARRLESVRSNIFDSVVLKDNPTDISFKEYVLPKEREPMNLAIEILKSLRYVSEFEIKPRVWEALDKSGEKLTPIVFFSTIDNENRHLALKIILNLSKYIDKCSCAVGPLTTSHAADLICAMLLKRHELVTPLSEVEVNYCLHIIYALSTDACNRAKIRASGVLPHLLQLVPASRDSTKYLILYTLLNFQYDLRSIDLMLSQGLFMLLIDELENYMDNESKEHKKKRELLQRSKKRKYTQEEVETIPKYAKTVDASILDSDSPSSSPRSYDSNPSPSSSRSMSPVNSKFARQIHDEPSDSEAYSPVCSDDEVEEVQTESISPKLNERKMPAENSFANSEIMKLLDIACRTDTLTDNNTLDKEDDDASNHGNTSSSVSPKKSAVSYGPCCASCGVLELVLIQIQRVTLLVSGCQDLPLARILQVLIRALNELGSNNKLCSALTNLLIQGRFFGRIVEMGTAHLLYQMTKAERTEDVGYYLINTLTSVGESNYGQGVLASLLRNNNLKMQSRAAITVAYIVKSRRLLYQFLNDGNVLTLLLDSILNKKDAEFTAEAMDALTAMCAKTLGIYAQEENTSSFRETCDVYEEQERNNLDGLPPVIDCDMRFLVHEKANDTTTGVAEANAPAVVVTVAFQKRILCAVSAVFATMLNSDFREGNEGDIHLKDCTVSGLKYFLNLIMRHQAKRSLNVPAADKYHILLEAFEMARIYIIPNLEKEILRLLIKLLDERNCLRIFEWSLTNYHSELMDTAVNYYLCADLDTQIKIQMFRTADYAAFSTTWFEEICSTVYESCKRGI